MELSGGNGRINIEGPNTTAVFALQDKIPTGQCTNYDNAMNGNWTDTPLSLAYFSKENQQIIQNAIRAGVYQRSNSQFLIGPQDCEDLQIIMRGVFLQHSKNLTENIPGQIQSLNNIVLDYAIPQVLGEAEGYLKYKRDVSNMWDPIAPPVQADFNEKSLELPRWFD